MVKSLPVYTQESYPDISLWWTIIFDSNKYPTLSKIIKAALSIFTGPHVESPFSIMNDIITPRASRMFLETYISNMSVKYSWISEGKSAAARYSRKIVMHDAINKTRTYYLRTARSRYVKKPSLYIAIEKRMQLKRKHRKDNEHEKVKYSFKT